MVINPFSGTGHGQAVWEELVRPFLEWNAEAVSFEAMVTAAQFEAERRCRSMSEEDAAKLDGIVCLGGDGTAAEVLNGLYHHRSGRRQRVAITPIPCGSGNALAKELGIGQNADDILRALLLVEHSSTF